MDWYYANDSDQQVPITEADMPHLVASGTIRRDTLVWNETLPDWKPCIEVRPDLFSTTSPVAGGHSTASAQTVATAAAAGASGAAEGVAALPSGSSALASAPAPPADGLAITALILGILSMVCWPVGFICGAIGVVCGHLSRKKARELTDGASSGGGLALAGLITSYLGLGISLLIYFIYIVMIVIGVASEM